MTSDDEKTWLNVRTDSDFWQEALKPLSRQMRKAPTPAEKALWQRLRRHGVSGYKFRRQHPVGKFIVDFYCADVQLAIEIDGSIHDYTQEEDALRQHFIEGQGIRVIRFSNGEVLQHIDAVIERIGEMLQVLAREK